MSHHSFNYSTFADDDCKHPVETHWLIEFDAWRATPATYMEPGEPAGIEFTAKHLLRVDVRVGDYTEQLPITNQANAEHVFGKCLDDELLYEAASDYYETHYGPDDEGRRVA